ncbi:hypothetical protein CVS40_7607 [Lucilia cuprina]|nr:hypothetical protein CVS40_7607 [Lucilia cuprina]KAI8121305.1 hypothetical protein CVS40_7607 [Lucilia cuprina]
MQILKLTNIILAFLSFITIAVSTEMTYLNPMETNAGGGKLFCVDPEPAKTYCLNILNYPRDRLEVLFEGVNVDSTT